MRIHSERLTLSPVSEGDAEWLLGVFRDPAVRRYLLDDALVSLEWVRSEIASSAEGFARLGAGLWAVRFPDATAIIGFVGFREFLNPPRLQLLYGLLPEYWGRGLATEAASRVCDYAFVELGFDRVEAAMDSPNRASIAVAGRLGMSPLGMSNQADTVFYTIDRETWTKKSQSAP